MNINLSLASLVVCSLLSPGALDAQSDPDISVITELRERHRYHYGRTGQFDTELADNFNREVNALLQRAPPGNRYGALYELGKFQRLYSQYENAIESLTAAAADAPDNSEIEFKSWIELATLHAALADHEQAAMALERAVQAAGTDRSRAELFDLAATRSQLEHERGEYELALADALDELRLAETHEDLFGANSDIYYAMRDISSRCEHQPIFDSKSEDDADRWGACRRAYASQEHYREAFREAADELGWEFIAEANAPGFLDRAHWEMMEANFSLDEDVAEAFRTEGLAVLVSENFSDFEQVVDEEYQQFMRGMQQVDFDISRYQDLHGVKFSGVDQAQELSQAASFLFAEERPDEALSLLEEARSLAEEERSTFLDLRYRNTTLESIINLYRDIGLQYLQHGRFNEAFETFESVRAAGLSELASAFEDHKLSNEDKLWLSRMVDAGSRESALVNRIAGDAIAGIYSPEMNERLVELSQVRAERVELLADPVAPTVLAVVAASKRNPSSLPALQAAVDESKIPVIMYWTTSTKIVVWVVSPRRTEVKAVFMPDSALADHVERLANSAKNPEAAFDKGAAQQLYAFLIQPFERHLSAEEIVIVPHGPLAYLPFEVLIDPRSGKFLIDHVAVSYAPNAAFAARALRQDPIQLSPVTAIYDYTIEIDEIKRIEDALSTPVRSIPSSDIPTHEDAISLLGSEEMIHVLLHGLYDPWEPLQSRVDVRGLLAEERELTAAEMLAADWDRVRLAVFSSCESARINATLSNELYGIPWAPLVGGTDTVVMSRWRVLERNSALWMEEFYNGLAKGSKSVAIVAAETMRHMRTQGDAHPFSWAGPMVVGR